MTSREQITARIQQELATGAACYSISAPGNFGKSALLRRLACQCPTAGLLPVYIDCNLLVEPSVQAFYELVTRQLLKALGGQHPEGKRLESLYQELAGASASLFTISRAFMSSMEMVLQTQEGTLALILDEFDRPWQNLPSQVFLNLRALKDEFPHRLAYLVATALPLPAYGREEDEGAAEFCELFEASHTLKLGGLTREEAAWLAGDILRQQRLPEPQPGWLDRLYHLAGGHPVLTRLLAPLLAKPDFDGKEDEAVFARLRFEREIQLECARIWRSLPPGEQAALLQHLEGVKVVETQALTGTLAEMGLVRQTPQGDTRIFALVFEGFVRDKLEANLPVSCPNAAEAPFKTMAYDPYREEIYLDGGARCLRLSGNAAVLFKYLYLRQSKPFCTKDELITAVWGNAAYSLENLDKLVSDLRQEIGDCDKRVIQTIHRRGIRMVGVAEWHQDRPD